MHANEARALSDKLKVGVFPKVFEVIRIAAEAGDDGTTIGRSTYGKHPHDVVRELIAKGYKAEFHSDQRDGDYIQISW